MLPRTFSQNKKIYLAYNNFRKEIFSKLSPRDAEAILYLLPWMLSVNDPAVPGYVSQLKKSVLVYGAATDQTLLKREAAFKRRFDIRRPGTLLKPSTHALLIQGLYTIGSVGSIAQTSYSDCDIWICIDKDDFDVRDSDYLYRKVNLIKDWMDDHLKMPVYFFVCDVEDIRAVRFGSLDDESSGSAQRNVLKEEFYRTMILINGRVPLWWVCFDADAESDVDYPSFVAQYAGGTFEDYDFIDMGSLEVVESNEYFGAALWQFNKALTHPLKSVMKMLFLDILRAASAEDLPSHRFRRLILDQGRKPSFSDPAMFTWDAILQHRQGLDEGTIEFIKACCYLRFDLCFYSNRKTIKEELAQEIFSRHPLPPKEVERLNAFAAWPLWEQHAFGEKIFSLLLRIYKEIKLHQPESAGFLTGRDLTIIGRKLAVCLEKKKDKLATVHKPVANMKYPRLTFIHEKGSWQVISNEFDGPVIAAADIVYCIAYLIWNDLYNDLEVRMAPNPTAMTLREINNLARQIKEIFGVFDITRVDFEKFLEPEKITKMLVSINFEDSGQIRDVNYFSVLYGNHWGELFFRRFHGPDRFHAFLESGGRKLSQTSIHYYVQRNNLYYEKIIERTKRLIALILASSRGSSAG